MHSLLETPRAEALPLGNKGGALILEEELSVSILIQYIDPFSQVRT